MSGIEKVPAVSQAERWREYAERLEHAIGRSGLVEVDCRSCGKLMVCEPARGTQPLCVNCLRKLYGGGRDE